MMIGATNSIRQSRGQNEIFCRKAYSAGCNRASEADWASNTIHKLHYEFDFWSEDVLLSSSPSWIVTVPAKNAIQSSGLTGAHFDNVEVSRSDLFDQLHPGKALPEFVWFKVTGRAGHDDFGTIHETRLVVSERALALLQRLGIPNAKVSDFRD
jgi:hypothetical protein